MEVDEGLWTWSTKNYVLYGDWFLDGHTHLFLSPLFHALSAVLFWALGPSIAVARLISAIAGTLSIGIVHQLVSRLTRNPRLAITTAIIMTFSQWSIVMSRRALIEPLELFLMLACALALTIDGAAGVIVGGAVLGLVGLTKINGLFFALPLCVLLVKQVDGEPFRALPSRRAWSAIVTFGVVAVLVDAIVYGGLFYSHPVEFRRAFLFELDGVHFEAMSHPLLRFGRFGLDPILGGRSVIGLYREEPFLLVLASIGLAALPVLRTKGSRLFLAWSVVGLPYFLLQMFQPIRYFYLLMPAFAYFAALTIETLACRDGPAPHVDRRLRWIAVGVFTCFDVSYAVMNAATNAKDRFTDVRNWLLANTATDARILGSGLLSTNVRRPVFTFYRLVKSPDQVAVAVRRVGINYVVVDDDEWPAAYSAEVSRTYSKVFQGVHSSVFRVQTP